jgi:hypothetical protein
LNFGGKNPKFEIERDALYIYAELFLRNYAIAFLSKADSFSTWYHKEGRRKKERKKEKDVDTRRV